MPGGVRPTLRPATPGDVPLLTRTLWLAFTWRDEDAPAGPWPDPAAPARYVGGFGRPGDAGVIAELDGRGAGAAWYRLLPADDPGYGSVAEDVPEITLGVEPHARGQGIATALMGRLLETAAADGVRALSLSVEPDNPARRLYERLGFEPAGASGGAVTLLRRTPGHR